MMAALEQCKQQLLHTILCGFLPIDRSSSRVDNHSAPPVTVTSGYILDTIPFTISTSPIASIASSHSVLRHQCADDNQLFIKL